MVINFVLFIKNVVVIVAESDGRRIRREPRQKIRNYEIHAPETEGSADAATASIHGEIGGGSREIAIFAANSFRSLVAFSIARLPRVAAFSAATAAFVPFVPCG